MENRRKKMLLASHYHLSVRPGRNCIFFLHDKIYSTVQSKRSEGCHTGEIERSCHIIDKAIGAVLINYASTIFFTYVNSEHYARFSQFY